MQNRSLPADQLSVSLMFTVTIRWESGKLDVLVQEQAADAKDLPIGGAASRPGGKLLYNN